MMWDLENNKPKWGDWLFERMKVLGLTAEQIAEDCGRSPATIKGWIRQSDMPKKMPNDCRLALAEALQIDLAALPIAQSIADPKTPGRIGTDGKAYHEANDEESGSAQRQIGPVMVRTGMYLYDIARGGIGRVCKLNDDMAELCMADTHWCQSWDHLAAMAVAPDTPSAHDRELAIQLGGDPFYSMANDIELLKDRLERQLKALELPDALQGHAEVLDVLASLARLKLDDLVEQFSRASNETRIAWLREDETETEVASV